MSSIKIQHLAKRKRQNHFFYVTKNYKENKLLPVFMMSVPLLFLQSSYGATVNTSGAVVLTNPTSTPVWDAGSDTYVGASGNGTITAADGETITGSNFIIGQNSGDIGTFNLQDSGSTLSAAGELTSGNGGTGTLNILNGAVITNTWNKSLTDPMSYSVNIGKLAGSHGDMNVSGPGSALNVSGTGSYSGIGVGLFGTGVLNIENAATVTAPRIRIGMDQSADGIVNVRGAGSKLIITNPAQWMVVAVSGLGNLTVSEQGEIDLAGYLRIGEGTDNGLSGTGNVQILSGGKVNTGSFTDIGFFQNTTGQLRVSGVDSEYTGEGLIRVGRQGNATLAVVDDGKVTSDQGISVATNSLGTGNINVGEGGKAGTLNVPFVFGGPGKAFINFNHSDNIDFTPLITGTINLNKTGVGTTTLSNNNTYAGITTVSEGVLKAGMENAFSPRSPTRVEKNGTLDLNGLNQTLSSLDNNGSVSFGEGSAGTTLSILGDYTGNGGSLNFNTVLGTDDSLTDKLVIAGNTTGNTNVSVNNVGGAGAATLNGIELITVNGNSDGSFIQSGRIVAGAYDYNLIKNNKNWYLVSSVTPVEPPVTEPENPPVTEPENPPVTEPENPPVTEPENPPVTEPENPPVTQPGSNGETPVTPPISSAALIVRPEAGVYAANSYGASTMFVSEINERLGETEYTDTMTGERKLTSLWIKNTGAHNRSNDSSGQLRIRSNRYTLMLGGDLADGYTADGGAWRLGVLGGYGFYHSKAISSVTSYHARGEVRGYTAGMYGTWYASGTDEKGYYLDSVINYSWFKNTVDGQDLAEEKYNSNGLSASLETGYVFVTSTSERLNSYIQPKAKVTWSGIEMENHKEKNGSYVTGTGKDNVQTSLGVRAFLKGHNKIDDGMDRSFKPFVELNWIHNTKNYGANLNSVEIDQAGTRNIGQAKLGVEGRLTKQLNLTGVISEQIGDKGYSDSSAMLGIKYSF